MCIIVLLPEPDGPTMATNSPGTMSRLTSSSAGTSTWPIWYTRLTRWSEIRGSVIGSVPVAVTELADRAAVHHHAAGRPPETAVLVGRGARQLAGRAGHDGRSLGQAGRDLGQGVGDEPHLDRGPDRRPIGAERHDGVVPVTSLEGR